MASLIHMAEQGNLCTIGTQEPSASEQGTPIFSVQRPRLEVGSTVPYLYLVDSQCVEGCELRQPIVNIGVFMRSLLQPFLVLTCSVMICIDIVAYLDCYFIQGIVFFQFFFLVFLHILSHAFKNSMSEMIHRLTRTQ